MDAQAKDRGVTRGLLRGVQDRGAVCKVGYMEDGIGGETHGTTQGVTQKSTQRAVLLAYSTAFGR